MLNNERNWTLKNLEKIAAALDVTVGSLTREFADIPIVREVAAQEAFPCPRDPKEEIPTDWVATPVPDEGGISVISKMYGIKIKDNSYSPTFKEGDALIAQKDSGKEIKSGDLVVYCCPKGIGHIGKISFHDKIILFKPLNPVDSQELLLDRGQLAMMDRVLYIKL
jgi:hypothetical protein